MSVKIGDKAPDFTLIDATRKPRSLKEFQGKKAVLAFFPAAFTGVCTKEFCTFPDSLANLEKMDAQVVGISVDPPFANKAYSDAYGFTFPLLSDYSRKAIRAYGVVHEDFAGLPGYSAAKRSIFVLDRSGVVKYGWVSDDPSKEPNYEEVTKALQSIP